MLTQTTSSIAQFCDQTSLHLLYRKHTHEHKVDNLPTIAFSLSSNKTTLLSVGGLHYQSMKLPRRIERLRVEQGKLKVKKVGLPLGEIQALKNATTCPATRKTKKKNWKKVKEFNEKQTKAKVKPEEPSDADKIRDVLFEASCLADDQNCSATRIQCAFRAYCARTALLGLLKIGAATKVQAAFRASQARDEYRQQRHAKQIQAIWRGVPPRRMRTQAIQSTIIIQAWWRMVPVRDLFRQFMAATVLQAVWRCKSLRTKYVLHQTTKKASTKIQAAWRCYRYHSKYIFDQYDIVVVQSVARKLIARRSYQGQLNAIQIQRIARGFNARKTYAIGQEKILRQSSALDIQRVFRGQIIRQKVCTYKYIIRSAVTIQSLWRRYAAQSNAWFAVGCAIEIQCLARKAAARDRFTKAVRSLNLLQRAVRVWLAKRRHQELFVNTQRFDAACLVQCFIRVWSAKQKYQELFIARQRHIAARSIQCAWRGYHAYSNKERYLSARLLQTAWRGYSARCDYFNWQVTMEAATMIQSSWRGFVVQQDYLDWQESVEAATKIQSAWRGFIQYADFAFARADAITIQSCYRGYAGRKLFKALVAVQTEEKAIESLRQHSSADIQRVFRGFIGRKRRGAALKEMAQKNAAIVIQSKWRSYEAEEAYFYSRGSAILIQSCARQCLARLSFKKTIRHLILSQSVARSWLDRNLRIDIQKADLVLENVHRLAFLEQNAARVIQMWYRGAVGSSVTHEAATKIQSFFRMVRSMVDVNVMIAAEKKKKRKKGRHKKSKEKKKEAWELMLFATEIANLSPALVGHNLSRSSLDGSDSSQRSSCHESDVSGSALTNEEWNSRSSRHRESKLKRNNIVSIGAGSSVQRELVKARESSSRSRGGNHREQSPSSFYLHDSKATPSTGYLKNSVPTSHMYLEEDPIPIPAPNSKIADLHSISSQSNDIRIGSRVIHDRDDESDMSSLTALTVDEASVEYDQENAAPPRGRAMQKKVIPPRGPIGGGQSRPMPKKASKGRSHWRARSRSRGPGMRSD